MGARKRLPAGRTGSPSSTRPSGVVGLRYVWYYSPLEPLVGWVYAGLPMGHLSAPPISLLVLVPVMILVPQRWIVMPLAALMSSVVQLLLLDSLVSPRTVSSRCPDLQPVESKTWAFLAVYFLLGRAVEAMVAG